MQNLGGTLYKPFNAQAVRPTELTPLTIAVSLAGASGDALGSIALREEDLGETASVCERLRASAERPALWRWLAPPWPGAVGQ